MAIEIQREILRGRSEVGRVVRRVLDNLNVNIGRRNGNVIEIRPANPTIPASEVPKIAEVVKIDEPLVEAAKPKLIRKWDAKVRRWRNEKGHFAKVDTSYTLYPNEVESYLHPYQESVKRQVKRLTPTTAVQPESIIRQESSTEMAARLQSESESRQAVWNAKIDADIQALKKSQFQNKEAQSVISQEAVSIETQSRETRGARRWLDSLNRQRLVVGSAAVLGVGLVLATLFDRQSIPAAVAAKAESVVEPTVVSTLVSEIQKPVNITTPEPTATFEVPVALATPRVEATPKPVETPVSIQTPVPVQTPIATPVEAFKPVQTPEPVPPTPKPAQPTPESVKIPEQKTPADQWKEITRNPIEIKGSFWQSIQKNQIGWASLNADGNQISQADVVANLAVKLAQKEGVNLGQVKEGDKIQLFKLKPEHLALLDQASESKDYNDYVQNVLPQVNKVVGNR